MSDKPKKGGRRGVMVGGKAVSDEDSVPPEPEKHPLRIENVDEEVDAPQTYAARRVREFIEGRITLGELEGIDKKQQYEMAQVGHQALSQGKLVRALTVFKGLVALDPYDAYFHLGLASSYHLSEQLQLAEHHYTEALRFNAYLSPALAHRGELLVMQGRLHEGAIDLLKATQLDPAGVDPSTQRARATLFVLKDQLGALGPDDIMRLAQEATDSRVNAVKNAMPQSRPRPRPRKARPRAARPGSRPRSRPRPSSKKKPR